MYITYCAPFFKITGGNLKRLVPFLFIAAFFLASACSDIEESSQLYGTLSLNALDAVSFEVHEDDSSKTSPYLTRTAIGTINDTELKTAGFGVFAAHTGIYPYDRSDIVSDFMHNQQVTYHSGNPGATALNSKLLEVGGHEFRAYAGTPGIATSSRPTSFNHCIFAIENAWTSGNNIMFRSDRRAFRYRKVRPFLAF